MVNAPEAFNASVRQIPRQVTGPVNAGARDKRIRNEFPNRKLGAIQIPARQSVTPYA